MPRLVLHYENALRHLPLRISAWIGNSIWRLEPWPSADGTHPRWDQSVVSSRNVSSPAFRWAAAATINVSNWHKAEEFDGATIATAIQGYNRYAKRVPSMPALDPKAQVNGPCRWASLFQLFPYESIDAHLSVARKWGRLCRIDEPISFFLDVPDHRCSSP